VIRVFIPHLPQPTGIRIGQRSTNYLNDTLDR
jgi:hypothetical protein